MFTKIKYGICLLLATAIVFQSAGKLIVVIDYAINKQYISKILCENKAKPILKCNGKCHLKKKLQTEDKKENSPSQSQKGKSEIQFFQTISYNQKTPKDEHMAVPTAYLLKNYSTTLSGVFHPPKTNSSINLIFCSEIGLAEYSIA